VTKNPSTQKARDANRPAASAHRKTTIIIRSFPERGTLMLPGIRAEPALFHEQIPTPRATPVDPHRVATRKLRPTFQDGFPDYPD
jgi:hypothetical protein